MFFLRFLRMIMCMTLTPFLWIIVFFFACFLDAHSPPMPSDVFFWLKKELTSAATKTVTFFKNELFGPP